MAALTLYKQNDQVLSFTLLGEDKVTPVSGATVRATVVDADGAAVTGADALTMTEADAAGSPGVYTTSIDETFDPEAATTYKLQVTAVKSGLNFSGEKDVIVKVRTL